MRCRPTLARGRAAPSPPGPKSDQIGPNPVIDAECLLLGVKQKSISGDRMSVHSQKQTQTARNSATALALALHST